MSIRDDIAAYARQNGLDPAWALAVADRESSFDPAAHASKTIHGLFQMSGAVRNQYGIPLTNDVGTQVKGFSQYSNGLKQDMASRIGRDPTPSELYLGHYWGPARAAGVITGHYSGLTARDVFTPRELAENPNLKPDKPIDELAGSITRDMDRRYAKFGGQGARAEPFDPSSYLTPSGDTAGDTTDNPTVRAAMSPDDLSATAPNDQKPVHTTRQMVTQAQPSAPLPITPTTPVAPSAPLATPSSPTSDDSALTTAALNDTGGGGLSNFADAFADIGKSMSGSGQPQAPAAPKLNLGDDVLQRMALAQQVEQPISGMPSIPGQTKGGSLPGQNQQAPSYLDPRMFGIQPTQQG